MAIIRNEINQSSSLLSRLKVAAILLLVIALISFIGYQIYLMFNKTKAETYFDNNEPFGILLVGQTGNEKLTTTTFISVATIVPQTKRIGFVSLYPQTRLGEEEANIGKRIAFSNPDDIVSDLESLLQINIPFYVVTKPGNIARLLDLIEGMNYFMHSPQIIDGENLPRGEFVLDGSLVQRLLTSPQKAQDDLIQAFLLYRYYSFILNLWQIRVDKWKILENQQIFAQAAKGLKTNLSVSELYTIASKLFSNNAWLPLFIEMPIKRDKDRYVVDSEAAKLFLKKFNKTLASSENPFFDRQPKMELKNGTDTPGLARKMRSRLSRKGIRILEFSNADHNAYKNSVLLGMSANSYFLEQVAKILKPKKVYHAVNKSLFTDLTLIIGKDHRTLSIDN